MLVTMFGYKAMKTKQDRSLANLLKAEAVTDFKKPIKLRSNFQNYDQAILSV